MEPIVSICIPAYRQPAFLRRALESVASQQFKAFEVIVTDDTPDDSVEAVAREFAGRFDLKYFRNSPGRGSPGNWNEAMRLASAPYIKFIHHDDWFAAPDGLARFVEMLDRNPRAALAFSASSHFDEHRNPTGANRATEAQVQRLRRRAGVLFLDNFVGAPSAVIFRNPARLQFDEKLKWVVDFDFYIRLLGRRPEFEWTRDQLVCITTEAASRVTAECLGNPLVEVAESAYLLEKLSRQGLCGFREKERLLALIKTFGGRTAGEIESFGVPAQAARQLAADMKWYPFKSAARTRLSKIASAILNPLSLAKGS